MKIGSIQLNLSTFCLVPGSRNANKQDIQANFVKIGWIINLILNLNIWGHMNEGVASDTNEGERSAACLSNGRVPSLEGADQHWKSRVWRSLVQGKGTADCNTDVCVTLTPTLRAHEQKEEVILITLQRRATRTQLTAH